mgnify:CR=1 FL=1
MLPISTSSSPATLKREAASSRRRELASGLLVVVDDNGCVVIEPDISAVAALYALGSPYDDRLDYVAFLDHRDQTFEQGKELASCRDNREG